MVICIAEDRQSEEVAVKLLLLSLTNHCPDLPIELWFPPATDALKAWLRNFPQVHLRTAPIAGTTGWNVKPYALLTLLAEGQDEVWWIDSDIILHRDFRRALNSNAPLSDATLVVTEEALYGLYRDQSYRAKAWGFTVGRLLPFNLNTGVVRVTQFHVPLLKKWVELLESEAYTSVQNLAADQKPFHLFGDQDVLTALLASQDFSDIPVHVLKRGQAIIQYFGPAGYTVQERLTNLIKGLPPFIHAQRDKPWHRPPTPPNWRPLRAYLDYVYLELSPYNTVAAQYRHAVGEDLPWLKRDSRLGQFLAALGLGNPVLTGLPIALLYSLIRLSKTIRGIRDQFDPKAAYLKLQSRDFYQSPSGVERSEPG